MRLSWACPLGLWVWVVAPELVRRDWLGWNSGCFGRAAESDNGSIRSLLGWLELNTSWSQTRGNLLPVWNDKMNRTVRCESICSIALNEKLLPTYAWFQQSIGPQNTYTYSISITTKLRKNNPKPPRGWERFRWGSGPDHVNLPGWQEKCSE